MTWNWTETTLNNLRQFLEKLSLTEGELAATPIGDGHSNLTYLVSDGRRNLVVRRPPPPPLPPGGHDVLREARILMALENTPVPTAKVLATCEASSVLDVPFYVMEFIDGIVITDKVSPSLASPQSRKALGEAMVDHLAALHGLDWKKLGLENIGKPIGFNARHLHRIKSLICDEQGVPAEFSDIYNWLYQNIPTDSGCCLIHNDYRIGNLMWDNKTPVQLRAILDWELATLGDPLFDLAYVLCSFPPVTDARTATQELSLAMLEEGFPSRDELVERYAGLTGANLSQLLWYEVMVDWKLAALYEYSRRRGEDAYYRKDGLVAGFLQAARKKLDSADAWK